MQPDVQAHGLTVRIIGRLCLVRCRCQRALQASERVRPQSYAEPDGLDHGVAAGRECFGTERIHGRQELRATRLDLQRPRLAGRPVGDLSRTSPPATFGFRGQEPGPHERPDVIEHGRRLGPKAIGEVAIRERLVEAQAEDPQAQWMREGAGLVAGCGSSLG